MFTEGLRHPELKKSSHLFLSDEQEKRKSIDMAPMGGKRCAMGALDTLIGHCCGLISGDRLQVALAKVMSLSTLVTALVLNEVRRDISSKIVRRNKGALRLLVVTDKWAGT